jgi:hypothetical protein
MEKWKARQGNLFESRPTVAELPEPQRQKALLLLGSLLTEALAIQNECEVSQEPREGGDDENYR